ncbi:MAG: lysine--tRNA ligase [Planctomycetes bacterium]|nr:lysine--tRNA ligase [Planctomycetota bacterium]
MLEKVQADRLAKLEQIRELGVDPYGGRYDSAEAIEDILARFDDDAEDQSADAAGRLMLIRKMGKLIFAHLRGQNAQMQIALSKQALDDKGWKLASLLDLGDIIAVAGPLHRTRTGEITIWADRLTMLCKALNPMPEKFHGLSNVEARYRQRYLDLMTNPDSMATLKKRSAIIEHMRRKLNARRFLEVETPVLQPLYGGAAARPFTTHHNTFDMDLFLRISPELYLKRLMVGGMERVYEFSRNFRNEGIDTSHNPEFTLLELYQAYGDYEVMMEITEELVSGAAEDLCRQDVINARDAHLGRIEQMAADALRSRDSKRNPKTPQEKQADFDATMSACEQARQEASQTALFKAAELCEQGKTILPYGDLLIDYTRPWRRAKYADLLAEHTGVRMDDVEAVRAKARQLGIEEAGKADALVINELFEATVEPHLVQPTFVMDYPAELCPLTRRKADDPTIALRFEAFIANMEIGNAYTELNDPNIQQANFATQIQGEDDETMRLMDEDFVTALRHGMPPAGGLGIGVDRVVMLLTNTRSIRDVILFPLLRPTAPH